MQKVISGIEIMENYCGMMGKLQNVEFLYSNFNEFNKRVYIAKSTVINAHCLHI